MEPNSHAKTTVFDRRLSRGFWIALALGLLIVAAIFGWAYSEVLEQRKRLALAEAHLPVPRAALSADERFQQIEVHVVTGLDGFSFYGRVESEEALADLKRVVASTNPPRPASYAGVRVSGAD